MSRENIPLVGFLDEERLVKAGDPDGIYGTAARYWINQHLPELARRHFAGPDRRILDLGCGDGPNARVLARAGIVGEYVGIDLEASPLWRERAGRHGALTARFEAHDAHRLDALAGEFDALVSVSAFEHFRDDRQVMQALGRRLRPGARGIIIVPSPAGNLVWGFRHGYRTYTPARFQRVLADTPFRLLEAIPSGGLPSVCANGAWRGASLALTYAVLGALWARHRGDRAAAKRQSPWISSLATTIQFGHLRFGAGRSVHRIITRGLHQLDARVPGVPSQWIFVIERA